MFKTYCIYIIIPVYNQVGLIDNTMNSILAQTYPQKELRVLFVDNCSDDGSYEKVLQYIKEYPLLVSVYRMDKPTKPARLLKQALAYLRFSTVHFSMFLNPGDIIYPDFMKKAIELMHFRGEVIAVYTNVDIKKVDGEVQKQRAVFTDSCIIDKEYDYSLFFMTGTGAKIQTIYKRMPTTIVERLVDLEKRTDIHDWMSAAFPNSGKVGYLTESLGCICEAPKRDVMFELMTKAYSLKSQFYMTETSANYIEQNKKDVSDMRAAYRCLAKNGLLYAVEEGRKGNLDLVKNCLIFSEMTDLHVVEEAAYQRLQDALQGNCSFEEVEKLLKMDSVKPPRHSFIF